MNKHTLIHAGTAVDNPHKYNVVIGTDIGQFSGTVECREEDLDRESKFFGYELAEIKALIKYAKAKARHYNALWAELVNFWGEMSKTRTYDEDAFWVKKIAQRINEYEEKAREWKHLANDMKESYHVKIQSFDALNKKRNRCEEYNHD